MRSAAHDGAQGVGRDDLLGAVALHRPGRLPRGGGTDQHDECRVGERHGRSLPDPATWHGACRHPPVESPRRADVAGGTSACRGTSTGWWGRSGGGRAAGSAGLGVEVAQVVRRSRRRPGCAAGPRSGPGWCRWPPSDRCASAPARPGRRPHPRCAVRSRRPAATGRRAPEVRPVHVGVALDQLVPRVPRGQRLTARDTHRLRGADDQVGAPLGPHDVPHQPTAGHDGVGVGAGHPGGLLGRHPQGRQAASRWPRRGRRRLPDPAAPPWRRPSSPRTRADPSVQPSRATATTRRMPGRASRSAATAAVTLRRQAGSSDSSSRAGIATTRWSTALTCDPRGVRLRGRRPRRRSAGPRPRRRPDGGSEHGGSLFVDELPVEGHVAGRVLPVAQHELATRRERSLAAPKGRHQLEGREEVPHLREQHEVEGSWRQVQRCHALLDRGPRRAGTCGGHRAEARVERDHVVAPLEQGLGEPSVGAADLECATIAWASEQTEHERAAALLVERTGDLPRVVTLVVHPVEPLGPCRGATIRRLLETVGSARVGSIRVSTRRCARSRAVVPSTGKDGAPGSPGSTQAVVCDGNSCSATRLRHDATRELSLATTSGQGRASGDPQCQSQIG